MKAEKIELACLRFSSNRAYGGDGDIHILAEDIKRNGIINPITVKAVQEEADAGQTITVYEVIAGRRRVQAVTLLGWKDIPCRILEGDEIDRAGEIAGSENINRMAMHPLDEAAIFFKLIESGRPIQELAKQYDRSVSAIWQRVQLLDLNDGIKELFREGKIELHAAAMLKSLEPDQQQAFCNKFLQKGNRVSIWDVKDFISRVRHDKLYGCMAGKACAGCLKRTFYTDKALFPELRDESDLCLDHECYLGKWQKLLSGKIKTLKAGNKSHAEANILACSDEELVKIFGKTLVLDGTDFSVVKITWDNRPADKPGKTLKPCFQIGIKEECDEDGNETGSVFQCVPLYWKEPAKEKKQPDAQQKNPFLPMVKILEMPEEEGQRTAAALWAKHKPKQPWETCKTADTIERTVKRIIFDKLMDSIVKKPDDDGDIDRFLHAFLSRADKDIIKKCAGSEKITDIKKLSVPKMFAALYAATFNTWDIPGLESIATAAEKKCVFADWAGVTRNHLKKMYKEELKVLMPTAAASTPDHGMKPAKKPAVKKPDQAKEGIVKPKPDGKAKAKG
jgi:ParB/RepB/Spo0J family partition protein